MTHVTYASRVSLETNMNVVAELWTQVGTMIWVVPVAMGLVATGIAMDRQDRKVN